MSQTTNTSPEPRPAREPRSFWQRLFRITPSDILRVAFLCVLVGLLLAAFGVDPRRLWVDFFGTLFEVVENFIDFIMHSAGDLVSYLLLGAVIVIPIWIVMRLLNAMGRR